MTLRHSLPPFLTKGAAAGEANESEVRSFSAQLATGMVELYSHLREKCTVDAHEHYVFTPRDLTLWVVQLIRYVHPADPMEEKSLFCDAWGNEARHIFRDRLVKDDQAMFDDLLRSIAFSSFGVDVTNAGHYHRYTALLTREGGSNFAPPTGHLVRVPNKEDYKRLVDQGVTLYEREIRNLDIHLFDEVVDNLAKLDRIISGSQRNDAFLIGKAGVGRRSLLQLMSFQQTLQMVSPSISKNYSKKEWNRDLKQVLQQSGIDKQPTVFFIEDHHLVEDFMLETLNSLLSAGEVPGLYSAEELEPLLGPLKDEFGNAQSQGTTSARTLFEYFVGEVRTFLRVVVSMDPSHPKFLQNCASNPALVKDCSVLWLDEWSEEGKELVCYARLNEFLANVDVSGKKRKSGKEASSIVPALAQFAVSLHNSQRGSGATPRHLVTLLQNCKEIYSTKIATQGGKKEHLEKGLLKLQEVSETVANLQEEAASKQIELTEKQLQAQQALEKIKRAMGRAAERKHEVEELEKLTEGDEQVNRVEKEAIEAELSEIKPILEAAKKAVSGIKQDHLSEIRSLKMPPQPIHDVLQGVLTIMGNYDSSWGSMKKFLAGAGMVRSILNFDARSVTPETRRDVEKLITEKANSFDPHVIYRVSIAAAPLAKWVIASVKYAAVMEKIAPMERKLAAATSNLAGVQGRLQECRAALQQIDQEVSQLQDEFETRTREASTLELDLDRAQKTLTSAKSLIGKLGGEKDRWSAQVSEIKKSARQLPVHAVLAAAVCTYLGHFPEDVRADCQRLWLNRGGEEENDLDQSGEKKNKDFSFLRFMASESMLLTWKSEGLPSDQLSCENGVIIWAGSGRCRKDPQNDPHIFLRKIFSLPYSLLSVGCI